MKLPLYGRQTARVSMLLLVGAAGSATIARGDDAPPHVAVELYRLTPPANTSFPTPSDAEGGRVVGFSTLNESNQNHAVLWSSSGVPIDLHPTNLSGFSRSIGVGLGGGQVVGWGAGTATGPRSDNTDYHALLWNGAANTAVDLHPTGIDGIVRSHALATDGTHQVGGWSGDSFQRQALLWSGSAESVVLLHPTHFNSNYISSGAMGVSGSQQVGFMESTPGDGRSVVYPSHALLWNSTPESAIDLHPTHLEQNFNAGTVAVGIGGDQQVGRGTIHAGHPYSHALLWTGTAASAVDLHPTGASQSSANATNGTQQAGYWIPDGVSPSIEHAMMWSGTADSAVDLHELLPSGGYVESIANSINAAGDVFGTAVSGRGKHAIMWIAPPHTASGSVTGGPDSEVTVAGRSPVSGEVHVAFESSTAGTFINTNSLLTADALASQTEPMNFALANDLGLVQVWDLSFTGTFTGHATLTFHFDPENISTGIDPADLTIAHFTDGDWILLPGDVDTLANTITVTTDSFSPFALAVVPEPSLLAPLAFVAAMGVSSRKRRIRRVCA